MALVDRRQPRRRRRRGRRWSTPNGGPGVLQVDGAFDAPRRGAGRHRRLHARGCGRRAPGAGRAVPRLPADGPRQVHGAEHRRVARRHVRLRARGGARRAAGRHVGAARLGLGDSLALADRGRGGRRDHAGRAVGIERRRPRGLLQSRHRADRRRRRERRVPVRAGPLRARLDPRQPARPGRGEREPALGRAGARVRPGQAAHGDRHQRRGRDRARDRRLRRPRQAAPRLRDDAGARRAAHGLRPRLPRRLARPARPRSGAA